MTVRLGVALLIVSVVEAVAGLWLLSPEYVTPMVWDPATIPAPSPAEDEPPLKVVVVQAPPLIVHTSEPVAPPPTVVVHVVVWGP